MESFVCCFKHYSVIRDPDAKHKVLNQVALFGIMYNGIVMKLSRYILCSRFSMMTWYIYSKLLLSEVKVAMGLKTGVLSQCQLKGYFSSLLATR